MSVYLLIELLLNINCVFVCIISFCVMTFFQHVLNMCSKLAWWKLRQIIKGYNIKCSEIAAIIVDFSIQCLDCSVVLKLVIRGWPWRTSAVREGREFVQCSHFADKGGSSDAVVHTCCCKNSRSSKFIVCPHGQGCRGGVIFLRFCADVLYRWPLT